MYNPVLIQVIELIASLVFSHAWEILAAINLNLRVIPRMIIPTYSRELFSLHSISLV